jgi:F0F1-type ATP synthase membrane subunit c/vacuolar-type H+-ATPase subunit K
METTPLNKVQRLIWLLLLASQAVYVAVALIHPGLGATNLGESPVLSLALGLVAVVSGGVAHVIWRRASGANLSLHEFSNRQPAQMFPLFIMAWSIDESIAIYGLVQALLGISTLIWLPFSLAGALLLMLHRPVEPPA